MRVLDVEDRVVVGLSVHRSRSRSICWSTEARASAYRRGVDADRLDQVLEGDDRAGSLAHADRLAVLEEVDQLADEDLEVHVGVVADAAASAL